MLTTSPVPSTARTLSTADLAATLTNTVGGQRRRANAAENVWHEVQGDEQVCVQQDHSNGVMAMM